MSFFLPISPSILRFIIIKYVFEENNNLSLLYVLLKSQDETKQSAIDLIEQGSVWINNKRIKNPDLVLANETVFVYKPEFPVKKYTLDNNNIKYEDDDIIIVYKEPGLDTVPTPMCDFDNLLYGIQNYLNSKDINYVVNPIHRLDKPTKGLVFFAKNKTAELQLHNLFRNGKIKKLYIAVTKENNLDDSILINDPVEFKNKKQDAITYVKFIGEYNKAYYYLIYPLTGRIHQIRKHFAKFISPIIGDALYGDGYTRNDELELSCFFYKFKHPVNNAVIEVEYLENKYIDIVKKCGK